MRSQVGVLLAFGSADFMALGQAEQGALCARLGLHEEEDRAGLRARPGAGRRLSMEGCKPEQSKDPGTRLGLRRRRQWAATWAGPRPQELEPGGSARRPRSWPEVADSERHPRRGSSRRHGRGWRARPATRLEE